MFHVIGEVIACIFWGILIGIIFTVILFYFPKLITYRYSYSLPGILLLVFAFIFFSIQGALFTGGFKLKKYIPSVEQVSTLLSSTQTNISYASVELTKAYPMLEKYIKDTIEQLDNDGQSLSDIAGTAQYFSGQIQGSINKYLWRRVAWAVGCIFLIGIYLFGSASKQSRYVNQPIDYWQ